MNSFIILIFVFFYLSFDLNLARREKHAKLFVRLKCKLKPLIKPKKCFSEVGSSVKGETSSSAKRKQTNQYNAQYFIKEGYARAIITYEGQIQLRINSQNFKKPEFIVEVDNNGEFQIDLLKAINDYSVQIEIVTKKYGRKSQKINFTHDNIDREPTFLVSDYGTRNYQPPLLNGTIHELFYSKSMNPFELYEIKKST
ncbi:hypothetical protein ACQ4LE_009659 [Meloidogyne hapla]